MTRPSTHGQARTTKSLLALTNHLLPVRLALAWQRRYPLARSTVDEEHGCRAPDAGSHADGRTLSRVRAERKHLRGGAGLAVAMGVMNVASYLFLILAARVLGPRDYGAFAALMGLLLV